MTTADDTALPAYVLVVEDERDISLLMTMVLTRAGYRVDNASDGIAGWEMLRTTGYDLLITDNNMPSVTGLDLIKKARADGMMLPVILTSGMMPTEDIDKNPWLQIDALLAKPFTPDALLSTVRSVLQATRIARAEVDFPMLSETVHDLDVIVPPKTPPPPQ